MYALTAAMAPMTADKIMGTMFIIYIVLVCTKNDQSAGVSRLVKLFEKAVSVLSENLNK